MAFESLLAMSLIAAPLIAYVIYGDVLWISGNRERARDIWEYYIVVILLSAIVVLVVSFAVAIPLLL